ncbi:NAD(P)H-hydrate epimerase [Roseovarius nitratireducens]|uniref:NAD(P)H-hydrate epimerase n=1 Tax=Roseovarius nitratireducens TaxID=2044597 RepID=UPI000CE276CD|nr:NAD(P)H-hydrate epimerase [Roseovarius nitratireducens]
MTNLLSAAQMRAEETAAIESGAVTGLELMERAGRGVVEAAFAHWPDLARAPQRALVLCGPGNNGGDGFVVARLLKEWGWDVQAFLLGDPERLPPDARSNHRRWSALGATRPIDDARAAAAAGDAALVVDALFGTGLTRPLEGVLADLVARPASRCVAVDIPSGLCADSGRVLGAAMRADLTVTFHSAKPGHYLADGPGHCGALAVADIGLRDGDVAGAITLCPAPGAARLAKGAGAHKFGHGHALVLTGGAGRTGAARLAARAALRVGAGLVTLGVPGSAQMEVAAQITALMLTRVNGAEGLAAALEDRRLTALCLGPGLGVARARALVPVALRAAHAPGVVLDADALTAFEDAPETLFEMLHAGCILTPHAGEFARLFPDIAETLNAPATKGPACSRVDATRAAAERAGCVVLLKGPDTVIAAPGGRCCIHAAHYDRAAPWLATAGSGDVLAGLVTGMMARGLGPAQAAEAAAWLHVEAARRFGPALIAEDLPETLPQVLRALGV